LLAALLGHPGEPIASLVGEFHSTADIPGVTEARERMLAGHPVIQAIREHRERTTLELRRARLEPYPDLTFGVAGGRDYAEDQSFLEFSVSLPLPIFDRAQGKKREARALEEIGRFDLTATEQRLIKQLDDTIVRLRSAGEQVTAYRDNILPKAEDAFRLVRGGFDAGKFSYLELVDTQRMFATVRLAYLGKLTELSSAQADMDALIGEESVRKRQNSELN
jgi:cobalt-zinc-cadmium efflux system outer membrane protein